jgi:glycine betaine/proline transport system substrate-binding protein
MNKYIKGIAAAVAIVAVGAYLIPWSDVLDTKEEVAEIGCGKVTIAEMNWASAEFMANVDKIILEEGYVCSV